MTPNLPSRPGAIERALNTLCRLSEQTAIAMLLITTTLVVLQVVGRNFFQVGLPWAEELARYGGLGIVYLAIPLLLLHDKHIAVDIIVSKVSGRTRWVMQSFTELVILLFCGLFLFAGYAFLMRAGKFTTPALSMPNLVFYLPAIVGMVLFTAVSLQRCWRLLNGRPIANTTQETAP